MHLKSEPLKISIFNIKNEKSTGSLIMIGLISTHHVLELDDRNDDSSRFFSILSFIYCRIISYQFLLFTMKAISFGRALLVFNDK